MASVAAPVESAEIPAPAPAPVQSEATPPPNSQPAVPPLPAVPQQLASIAPSDAALGFKPSAAPPLDPSISQFVSPPILQRYQQTAATAGIGSEPVVATANRRSIRHRKPQAAEMGEGGPETMTGAVVANLDALQPATNAPSAYASSLGLPATAVVFFPGDSVYLNAEARAQVRATADEFKARGGQGYVRVVGHSSSRTANMPLERHLEIIYRKSKGRADAVVRELVRDGVPAGKVLMEAVGDSQPVYYESMPKGEDGNRRVEIFLQG
jgi:outer membrane protein OmpA-like peptidoglycan-associated protein